MDGTIQARDYSKTVVYAPCHEEHSFTNTATVIIPYSTEYLRGCRNEKEIIAQKKKEEENLLNASKSIFKGE